MDLHEMLADYEKRLRKLEFTVNRLVEALEEFSESRAITEWNETADPVGNLHYNVSTIHSDMVSELDRMVHKREMEDVGGLKVFFGGLTESQRRLIRDAESDNRE